MDVVYVVRPGDTNESLRYSLRSLKNIPHDNVFIAGYRPYWVRNVVASERDQENVPDLENVNKNLILTILDPRLSDYFILMNDDFFIMEEMDHIPVLHQGPLQERIDTYKSDNRFHQAYSLVKTQQRLQELGVAPEDMRSFELHVPMVFHKEKLLRMYMQSAYPLFAIRPRTLYGNLYDCQGEKSYDVKESIDEKSPFLSAGRDFESSPTGRIVKERFTDPSPYERESSRVTPPAPASGSAGTDEREPASKSPKRPAIRSRKGKQPLTRSDHANL